MPFFLWTGAQIKCSEIQVSQSLTVDRRRGTPWSAGKFKERLTFTITHNHNHTSTGKLECPVHLTCMSLDRGRKRIPHRYGVNMQTPSMLLLLSEITASRQKCSVWWFCHWPSLSDCPSMYFSVPQRDRKSDRQISCFTSAAYETELWQKGRDNKG